jgi:hypothetical protein
MTSGAVLAVDSHTAPRMLTWLAPACQRLPTCGDKLQITWVHLVRLPGAGSELYDVKILNKRSVHGHSSFSFDIWLGEVRPSSGLILCQVLDTPLLLRVAGR